MAGTVALHIVCSLFACGPTFPEGRFYNPGFVRRTLNPKTQENLLLVPPIRGTTWINPDAYLTTPALIRKNGYPVEVHHVTTKDGFILELHRIPPRKNDMRKRTGDGKVVYVLHGNFQTSSDWLMNGVNNSLGYILADAGFDVWLGNFRGNTYSDKHMNYTKNDKEFWDFSFHEMALYDFPASVDYILNKTKVDQIHYVGYSIGTSIFYVAMGLHPEYNNKIAISISLGPSAYAHNWKSPFRYFSLINRLHRKFVYEFLGDHVVRPDRLLNILAKFSPAFCTVDAISALMCRNILFLFGGFDPTQLDVDKVAVIMGHTPAGVSNKQLIHILQLVRSRRFAQFDYGISKNLVRYRSFRPPDYDLSKIKTKVALISGLNDFIADPEDVALLVPKLSNIVDNYVVPYKDFSHTDFTYAKDARKLVYDHVLELLEKY